MKYSSIFVFIEKNYIFFASFFPIVIWFLFFGNDLIFEPFVWDDLHFFRKYSSSELISTWVGNWDPDNIETPSYRPLAVLYYHISYLIFGENTFFFRLFLILLMFILIYITNKFFFYLDFKKKEILIFSFLIIFSKIFTTLVSWFTISALIICYIFVISSIFCFLKFLENNNILLYILSFLFGATSILIREELYMLPGLIIFFYFLKFGLSQKNYLINLLKLLPFFLLVILLILLRKKYVPEAAHIELINNSLEFGGSSLSLGSLIKVLKSSFLPMGYVSSQYSDLIQSIFSYLWLFLILISLIVLKINFKKKIFTLRIFALLSLIFVSSIPHITIARSFGIFLPSIFAMLSIAILLNNLLDISLNPRNPRSILSKFLFILITISGIIGGIYRSDQQIKSMSQFSNYIVFYDTEFIFGYKNRGFNLSIPKERYNKKKKHLEKLNIIKFETDPRKIHLYSENIKKSKYDPLWF